MENNLYHVKKLPFNLILLYFHCFSTQFLIISAQEATTEATTAPNYDGSTPDPAVALEGSCVVVCDALTSPAVQSGPVRPKYKPPRRLAFSVVKRDNRNLIYPNDPKVIMFDHLLLNIGNGYDIATSTFRAKVAGTYSFQFTIINYRNPNPLAIALVVGGGTAVLNGFAYSCSSEARHDVAHNSGLVYLNEGDQVRLVILKGDMKGGWQHSTFSGFLLFED